MTRFALPKAVARGDLQVALLGIWTFGLIAVVMFTHRAIPQLKDRQLDIAPLEILKDINPAVFEAIYLPVLNEDRLQLRQRLAEHAQQRSLTSFWGTGSDDAKKLRELCRFDVRQRVDSRVGSPDWSQNWEAATDGLIDPEHLAKINAAHRNWYELVEEFLPAQRLEDKRAEKRRDMENEYQKILIALCSPWITVMVSTLLFGSATLRRQKIHRIAVVIVVALSVLFLVGVACSFWAKLHGPDYVSANPHDLIEPAVAFLASLVGTTVTFIFPEADADIRTASTSGAPRTPDVQGPAPADPG